MPPKVDEQGAGPSAFSAYASRFLNGRAGKDTMEGSQVSVILHTKVIIFISHLVSH